MKLVLNTPGTYLSRRGDCFCIRTKEEENEISARKVEQIILTTRSAISTDAIELALSFQIDIIILKYTGQPLARIWHPNISNTNILRRKQLQLVQHPYGLKLVINWMSQKLYNQAHLLRELAVNRRDERKQVIHEVIRIIECNLESIKKLDSNTSIGEVRNNLLGYEGYASRKYFETISFLLPKKYQFKGRSKRPSLDPFNCVLNYCYGMLYATIENLCLLVGFDPYIGIMHTDQYNKKSFVFDLIERYRGLVDEFVVKLFTRRKIKQEFFDIQSDSEYLLNEIGKRFVIQEYFKYAERRRRYKGKNLKLKDMIHYDLQLLAKDILEVNL